MDFCPFCEEYSEISRIEESPIWEFRGEKIQVDRVYYKCSECEEEWEIWSEGGHDPFEQLYKEYERRAGKKV